MTIDGALRYAALWLQRRGWREPQAAEAVMRVAEKTFGMSWAQLILQSDYYLTEQSEAQFLGIIYQLAIEHKPLAYALGTIPFRNLDLLIQPPILIPRPETEWWCDLFIEQLRLSHPDQPITILDLCTGSGCIGLAIAKALPYATVIGADISPIACVLAAENAARNQISNFTVVRSDMFSDLGALLTQVDFIVSNPPYVSYAEWLNIDPSVRAWEDYHALVSGNSGFAHIAQILAHSRAFLSPSRFEIGRVWMEIGAFQGIQALALAYGAGYESCSLLKDVAGRDRVLVLHS